MSIRMAICILIAAFCNIVCMPVHAMTPESACQAVRDFEDDENLACTYGGGCRIQYGLFGRVDGGLVWATVQVVNEAYRRRYKVAETGAVTDGALPDLDPSKNPSAALPQPITEAQAEEVAEDFAARVFSDYSAVTWSWRSWTHSSDLRCFQVQQQLTNGALTDRQLGVTVSLGSGQVTFWHAQDYTLPAAASATPSLSAGQAEEAAVDVFPGLDGLTPDLQELRYFSNEGLAYLFSYDFDLSQVASGTPLYVLVNADTGEIAWTGLLAASEASPVPAPASRLANLLTGALAYVLRAVATFL